MSEKRQGEIIEHKTVSGCHQAEMRKGSGSTHGMSTVSKAEPPLKQRQKQQYFLEYVEDLRSSRILPNSSHFFPTNVSHSSWFAPLSSKQAQPPPAPQDGLGPVIFSSISRGREMAGYAND